MLYRDDEMIMISALQHYLFCPRQCALIHLDQQWGENDRTAAGRVLHERIDGCVRTTRHDVHMAGGLRLVSRELGMTGIADVVEFYRQDTEKNDAGERVAVPLKGRDGFWRVFPVEYKRGKVKADHCDEVQLCAQAMCMEEMLGAKIAEGALFYGQDRRRHAVPLTAELRGIVMRAAADLHAMIHAGKLPEAIRKKSCSACSLLELCRPGIAGKSAVEWLDRNLRELTE